MSPSKLQKHIMTAQWYCSHSVSTVHLIKPLSTPLIAPCENDTCDYSAGMIKRPWHILYIPQSAVRGKFNGCAAIITSVRTWFSDTTSKPDYEKIQMITARMKNVCNSYRFCFTLDNYCRTTRQQTSFIQPLLSWEKPFAVSGFQVTPWQCSHLDSGVTVSVSGWMLQLYESMWHNSITFEDIRQLRMTWCLVPADHDELWNMGRMATLLFYNLFSI